MTAAPSHLSSGTRELREHIAKERAAWDHKFGGKLGIFFSNDELELLEAALSSPTPQAQAGGVAQGSPDRDKIAKAIYASWLQAEFCTDNHFEWFEAGKDNPDSCVHVSNVAKAYKAADRVIGTMAPQERTYTLAEVSGTVERVIRKMLDDGQIVASPVSSTSLGTPNVTADEETQIKARLAYLYKKQEDATSWGAAVGARHEEIKSLEGRLSLMTSTERGTV